MSKSTKAYQFDLDQFFTGGNSWQAGLLQQVEQLTAKQARWKPSPTRHSIWDILIHVNFWKEYAIASVRGTEKPDSKSGNWSLVPQNATEVTWLHELARTRKLHDDLKQAADEMGDALFNTEDKLSNYIRQLISHDAYHAGQIGLLRVMQGLMPIE